MAMKEAVEEGQLRAGQGIRARRIAVLTLQDELKDLDGRVQKDLLHGVGSSSCWTCVGNSVSHLNLSHQNHYETPYNS